MALACRASGFQRSMLSGPSFRKPDCRHPAPSSQLRVLRVRSQKDDSQCTSPAAKAVREIGKIAASVTLAGALTLLPVDSASARLEGVDKPELLPQEFTRVIDTGGFLSAGQVRRLSDDLGRLENDTGFKLRVLSQSYPNTPGLAIRDYWNVDDDTVVFVADPTFKNILNFNVGSAVDLRVPRSFWSRLAGKYGNMFYWKENGEDAAIEAAVVAIDSCLREEPGPRQCSDIK